MNTNPIITQFLDTNTPLLQKQNKQKEPRFYTVYQEDSRGVYHTIAEHLDRPAADDLVTAGMPKTQRVLYRERKYQPNDFTLTHHPAFGFLHAATCHGCGHPAAAHSQDGKICEKCYWNTMDDESKWTYSQDTEGNETSSFDTSHCCTRNVIEVLLDGVIDVIEDDIPLDRLIERGSEVAEIHNDASGLGACLTRKAPSNDIPKTSIPF
jgi:hypothetical protein